MSAVWRKGRRPGCGKWLLLASLSASVIAGAAPLAAATPVTDARFRIAAGPLATALETYARVTGRQLFYASALVAGRRAPALNGRMSAEAALARLLANSGLKARAASGGVIVIEAAPPEPAAKAGPPAAKSRKARPTVVEQPGPSDAGDAAIVVTGSHIRGNDQGSSPLITIDRQAIDHSGYGTIAEVIAALPQNFGGTGTEDTSLASSDRSTLNSGLGSSANLRGLGSDATLTLVNGRRVAGSGGKGDFADLSTIPTGAIERIEVMPDGASAVYGSDAVGGVLNIILKHDLDGGESRLRIGSVTSGHSRDLQASQLLGRSWSTGHLLVAYEFQRRTALPSSDRRYAASADLRPLGGDDFRSYYSDPGTILAFDPVTGSFTPRFAIPRGQDGVGLTLADLAPGANLDNSRAETDLLPRQTRHSAYATIEQDVSDRLTLYAEGRYANRHFAFRSASPPSLMIVTRANPNYIDIDGSGLNLVAYSFRRSLGPLRTRGHVESYSGTLGATLKPWGDWQIDMFGSYAQERTGNRSDNLVNASFLDEALGTAPDNPATSYDPARDGYFNPYGDNRGNSPAVLAFLNQGFQSEAIRSRLYTANMKADGTLLSLPGGALKLAVGVQLRREGFVGRGETFIDGISPAPISPAAGHRTVAAFYGELVAPLVGVPNARPGLRRLDLSFAVRREHYSDFGSSLDPKFGILWEPVDGWRLRASYGRSFRAPSLRDLRDPYNIVFTQLPTASGALVPVLYLSGGNPTLEPERARSWSAGTVIAPRAMPSLRVEAGFFQTRFGNRIGQPVLQQILQTLIDPALSPFVRRIDPAGNADDLAAVEALLADPNARVPSTLPPTLFQAIVDGRVVNTSSVLVRGIDAALSKRFGLGAGSLSLAANATYLVDYKTRLTPLAAEVERVDTLGFPPDFRLRGTADWQQGALGATLAVNCLGGFTDNVSIPSRPVRAWTTLDLQLRYQPAATRGWRRGLTVALSIQNLFDTDPPFVNQSSGIGYDASTADPLGRFVALQISRKW